MGVVSPPELLLPADGLDKRAWAVIACDQFTSEPAYWDALRLTVGDKPSTLELIFPEVYLGELDEDAYVERIHAAMRRYLSDGTLTDKGKGFVLVERTAPGIRKRLGLLIAIDLEAYTYEEGIKSPIRASEKTVLERIPPRMKIRRGAPIELSHVMVLYDDPERSILELLDARKNWLEKLYDFDLNMEGGHLSGYLVKDVEPIIRRFEELQRKNPDGLLFVIGDGNHSLAAAKAYWDEIKVNLTPEEREGHPARFALVEANNAADENVVFKPIHRIVYGAGRDFLAGLEKSVTGTRESYSLVDGERRKLILPEDAVEAYKAVQAYIDDYLAKHKDASVDYVHDKESLERLAGEYEGAIAIFMPALTKEDVFKCVGRAETLTRKAFSLGSARAKRYYYEARKITY